MANRWQGVVLLSTVGLLTSGCLLKDASSTWYLESNGAVTWAITEKDVRSDAQSPFDRQNEELSYITAARAQNHPVARGLAELGPLEIRTRLLHATVPFTVFTEAKFVGVDVLGAQLISHLGLAGTSVVTRAVDGTTWTFTALDPHATNGASEPDDDLDAAVDTLDGLKVVLLDGRFISAEGFDLSQDCRVATLKNQDDHASTDADRLTLKLQWR